MQAGKQLEVYYNDTPDHVSIVRGRVLEMDEFGITLRSPQSRMTIPLARIVRIIDLGARA